MYMYTYINGMGREGYKIKIKIKIAYVSPTYCVRSVKAALVMLDGKCKPLIISCHNFLLITSTKPPRAITKLYNSYKSSTDLAMIGNRLMGVPTKEWQEKRKKLQDKLVRSIDAIYCTNDDSVV